MRTLGNDYNFSLTMRLPPRQRHCYCHLKLGGKGVDQNERPRQYTSTRMESLWEVEHSLV